MNNEMNSNGVNNNLINVQPITPNNVPNVPTPTQSLPQEQVNNIPNTNVIPVNSSNVVPQPTNLNNQIITPESNPNNEVNNLSNNIIPVSSESIVPSINNTPTSANNEIVTPQPNPIDNSIITPNVPNNNEIMRNNTIPSSSLIGTPIINNTQTANNSEISEPAFEPKPINVQSIMPNNQTQPLDSNPLPINNNLKSININSSNNNNPLFNNNSPINNSSNNNPIDNTSNNNQEKPTQDNNQTIQNQPNNGLTENDKEAYIKAFIGKNYDKIKDLKFSLPAFFLNVTYMLYRKMFLYSILLFIIVLIVGTIFPIGAIALPIAAALLFKPLYMNFVKAKVTKIITNNSGKSKEEIMDICSKKGGTSIGLIFLGGFVETIIIAIYLAIMFFVIGATFINAFIKYLPEGLENGSITIEESDNFDYSGFDTNEADY